MPDNHSGTSGSDIIYASLLSNAAQKQASSTAKTAKP